MDILKNTLSSFLQLNAEEWSAFENALKVESHKENTVLVNEGSIASKIYFVQQGILRTYFLKKGKEISTYFACDNQFVTAYSSFISQKPSFEYLQVLEDSVLYSMTAHKVTELSQAYPKIERLFRIYAEQSYLCVLERTILMQSKTAKERYLDFIEKYDKKIVCRVAQNQIASYLGIEPESLSRIRKKLSLS
ncbi:Crp/Fnr family transcriptional regulator [Sporocytophaga myxococcoides]|uniref:Crp/Fnr family transcriptional regulator n=1 Tax=Sporocytophaga myxococcoides TaxID=153721 RepID=UPI000410511C|nr:Crp/Fnr family transcriptional regulator [Sporocytophaga myxococcoides]